MTEAGWTREKPKVAGWYWNRINGTVGIALIMRRDCQLYAWLRFKDAWLSREGWLDYIHGEWLGPITPDSYQQGWVAALTFAAEQAGKGAKLWDAGMKPREAEALREFQRWLQGKAQQAQEAQ